MKNNSLGKLYKPEEFSDKVIPDIDFTDKPEFNVMFLNALIDHLKPRVRVL